MVPWFPLFLEFVPSYLEIVPGYPGVVPGYLGGNWGSYGTWVRSLIQVQSLCTWMLSLGT